MFTLNKQQEALQICCRWYHSRLASLLLLLPISLIALLQPPAVKAGSEFKAEVCVLACNAKTRRCSYYVIDAVPRGYRIQKGVPPGYKVVKSSSVCDNKLCSTNRKSICSAIPIGQVATSVDPR